MKIKLLLTFFIFSLTIYSQEKYEYYGGVKLNGDDKTIISYRLVFTEQDGKITGYSVTDLGGEHETKNVVSGFYNKKTKEFTFKEKDILYTKSPISDDMFCFINFTGKVKLVNDNSAMEGDFKGLFKNNTKCIDGTITLIGNAKIYKMLNKLNKKIQRSGKVDEETKRKVNPVAILDSLKVNNLIKNQNLNVFVDSDKVLLEIWDAGKEDGDKISLRQNGEFILRDYQVTNKKRIVTIDMSKTTTFQITALNEGTVAPNTAMIRLVDKDRTVELMSNLKQNESASITLIKRKE
ncbi:hypothetical protein [Flavobacterium coralii]|uniref:hypothetical protein n=1 Tax=Flavobacterium coralii TaxID=2838017 RepID=UPI000C4FC908|nr:hypothetical protein [Flavobacterium coralii]MBF01587.1 hypothetical protein [Flavobacterium sp.]MBY8962387.1 hypothetical protein [Flavobacterium coralii]|tara:strand:- start:2478 stop:3356 length:879 start_codon:yes stop_codon:yes gene_type:complete